MKMFKKSQFLGLAALVSLVFSVACGSKKNEDQQVVEKQEVAKYSDAGPSSIMIGDSKSSNSNPSDCNKVDLIGNTDVYVGGPESSDTSRKDAYYQVSNIPARCSDNNKRPVLYILTDYSKIPEPKDGNCLKLKEADQKFGAKLRCAGSGIKLESDRSFKAVLSGSSFDSSKITMFLSFEAQ